MNQSTHPDYEKTIPNPFKCTYGSYQSSVDRLHAVKSFNIQQCIDALSVRGLQLSVQDAINRRITKLRKEGNVNSHTHPDYKYDDMPLAQAEAESDFIKQATSSLADDVAFDGAEARMWLGTLLINGEVCQAQLVVTPVDSHFVDET